MEKGFIKRGLKDFANNVAITEAQSVFIPNL
jgi:hypothetical protein